MSTEVFLFAGEFPQSKLALCLTHLPAAVDRLVVIEPLRPEQHPRYPKCRERFAPWWPRMRYIQVRLPGGAEYTGRLNEVIRQALRLRSDNPDVLEAV